LLTPDIVQTKASNAVALARKIQIISYNKLEAGVKALDQIGQYRGFNGNFDWPNNNVTPTKVKLIWTTDGLF